jgi:hypothetical protein
MAIQVSAKRGLITLPHQHARNGQAVEKSRQEARVAARLPRDGGHQQHGKDNQSGNRNGALRLPISSSGGLGAAVRSGCRCPGGVSI